MDRLLFRVADVFAIRGRGVVVVADLSVSWADIKLRVNDAIELVCRDGTRLRTSVRGIEMLHVPVRTPCPVAILLGPEVEKADVEVGAELWRVEPAAG